MSWVWPSSALACLVMNFCGPNNYLSKTCWVHKMVGPKKFRLRKIGQKSFWPPKKFWPKFWLGSSIPKCAWVQTWKGDCDYINTWGEINQNSLCLSFKNVIYTSRVIQTRFSTWTILFGWFLLKRAWQGWIKFTDPMESGKELNRGTWGD